MNKIKKGLIFSFVTLLLLFGGLFFSPTFNVEAATSLLLGDVYNNVIYVDFSDCDGNYVNQTPTTNYTNTVSELMEATYNTSLGSVNAYYKAQSCNKLNLVSRFYTDSGIAFKTCYTLNQLLPYSKTNTDGYLEYDICSYTTSTAPSILSESYFMNTTHIFSAYDCGNSSHNGMGSDCDLSYSSSDDVACLCAYYQYVNNNPSDKIYDYKHLEKYLREKIALKTVVSQITETTSLNLDKNSDGKIDALTFVFSGVDNANWNDLLWPHKSTLINLSNYLPSYLRNVSLLSSYVSNHGVRNETTEHYNLLLSDSKLNNINCYEYNLFLVNYLTKSSPLIVDGNQILKSYTLAHELAHVLGLPDYYSYYDDSNEDALYYWDLMDSAFNSVPPYLTTYNRKILGFLSDDNVQELIQEGTYSLYPTCYDEVNNNNNNSNNVLAYIYEGTGDYAGQYIYFEYRTNDGNFESGLNKYALNSYNKREEGLLIYRVDTNIKQVSGYSSGLSAGNYYGYPYNVFAFRNGSKYVLNSKNSTFNDIEFQTYDTSQNQSQLTNSNVTYQNSGLNVSFVKVENGMLSFNITGGNLQASKDLSKISLNGDVSISHEVYTTYTDLGINYDGSGYSEDDFNIVITDNVNKNINKLGTYTYTYKLTLKTNSSITKTLSRTVTLQDTTAPILIIYGKTTVYVENLGAYVFAYEIKDNYYGVSELIFKDSGFVTIEKDKKYTRTYTLEDPSGNKAEPQTITIIIQPKTDFSAIKLVGNSVVNSNVFATYVDAGIVYGSPFSESQFTVQISNNIATNKLGQYKYTYILTYNLTGESFELSRTVNVVDKQAPTISIIDASSLTMYLSEARNYNDLSNVSVSDNYDNFDDITITTRLVKVNKNTCYYYYKATDKSGNASSEVYRVINLKFKDIEKSQINISYDGDIYTTLAVKFTVTVNYNIDNDTTIVPTIYFSRGGVNINEPIKESQFYFIFENAGIYVVTATIEENSYELIDGGLVVDDINNKPIDAKILGYITAASIIGIIMIFTIVIIIAKYRAIKIKKNLDRY